MSIQSYWQNFSFKTFLQKAKKIAIKGMLYFLGISVLMTILFRFLPIPFTPLMFIRSVEQKIDGKPLVFEKDWESIDNISDHLVLAVVCAEDQNFEDHNGFDVDAIEKAIETNKKRKKKGRPVHGASTISQQVAKNVFLFPSRSWIRKGFEVYFTMLIELLWSKERIMEVYLNVVELGNGIYGAEAASKHYFGKTAANLRPSEAAALAAILPNPRVYSVKNPTRYVAGRKQWILRQMAAWGGSIDLNDGNSKDWEKEGK